MIADQCAVCNPLGSWPRHDYVVLSLAALVCNNTGAAATPCCAPSGSLCVAGVAPSPGSTADPSSKQCPQRCLTAKPPKELSCAGAHGVSPLKDLGLGRVVVILAMEQARQARGVRTGSQVAALGLGLRGRLTPRHEDLAVGKVYEAEAHKGELRPLVTLLSARAEEDPLPTIRCPPNKR